MEALTIALALSAPAPLPKDRPPPRPSLPPGEYVLVWYGTESPLTLSPGGGWTCVVGVGEDLWTGGWYFDARTSTLHVTEWSPGGDSVSWAATLDCRLRGTARRCPPVLPGQTSLWGVKIRKR